MHLEITWTSCLCPLSPYLCQAMEAIEKYCLISILIPLTCPFQKELVTWNVEKIITIPYVSCVPCHMSDVTRQLSHVMCHVFFTKWWSLFVAGLLSMGSIQSSVYNLIFFNVLTPNTYLSRHVVIRIWSLKKANWLEFNLRDFGIC